MTDYGHRILQRCRTLMVRSSLQKASTEPIWVQGILELAFALASVEVRPLRASDYSMIRKIERESIDEYLLHLKKSGERDTAVSSVNRAYFGHYLKMGSSFVAEADGKIVGYILSQPASFLHSHRGELWLEYIVVVAKHRRKRIGSMLLTATEAWARERNFDLLHTNLNPHNPESKALLEKHGFDVRNWLIAQRVLK